MVPNITLSDAVGALKLLPWQFGPFVLHRFRRNYQAHAFLTGSRTLTVVGETAFDLVLKPQSSRRPNTVRVVHSCEVCCVCICATVRVRLCAGEWGCVFYPFHSRSHWEARHSTWVRSSFFFMLQKSESTCHMEHCIWLWWWMSWREGSTSPTRQDMLLLLVLLVEASLSCARHCSSVHRWRSGVKDVLHFWPPTRASAVPHSCSVNVPGIKPSLGGSYLADIDPSQIAARNYDPQCVTSHRTPSLFH